MSSIPLSIGNTLLKFSSRDPEFIDLLKKEYSCFKTNKKTAVHTISITPLPEKKRKNSLPSIRRSNGVLSINRYDFSSKTLLKEGITGLAADKDAYSLDAWLRVFLSAYGLQKNLILLHSACVVHKNKALLFAGVSGSGKSTITRIFGRDFALTDELSCLFISGGKVFCSASPFWGELKKPQYIKNAAYEVKALCFLKHGRFLSSEQLRERDFMREFLKTTLFFSKNKNDLKTLMDNTTAVYKKIKTFRLVFSLDNTKNDIIDAMGE